MFLKSVNVGKTSVVLLIAGDGGEEALVLSPGEWKRLSASLGRTPADGDEITPELYDRLHDAAARTAALRDCALLLRSRDRSEAELKRKLREKRHPAEAIESALAYVKGKGYLNEEAACLRYAEAAVRSSHYGPRRIAAYLRSHGYDAKAASSAACAVPEEDYRAALDWQLTHKYPALAEAAPAEREKIYAALLRLGFTSDEIRAALRERS